MFKFEDFLCEGKPTFIHFYSFLNMTDQMVMSTDLQNASEVLSL